MSSRPHLDSLQQYLEKLFDFTGDAISFIVLYGSMARGDWSKSSDYDLLVGLEGPATDRFIDRLIPYGRMSWDGRVEALPYHLAEIENMFTSFNLIALAALRDGIVLFDQGAWSGYQQRYSDLIRSGQLISEGRGWTWTAEAERMVAASAGPDERGRAATSEAI